MLCKVCGAQIPDDATECEFCGAKVDGKSTDIKETNEGVSDETKIIDAEEIRQIAAENDAEFEEESDKKEDSEEIFDDNERRRREQMKKMMEDKRQQLSEIERRRNEKRQRPKRNKILLIGLICALAVAAAGIGVYYVAQNVGTPAVVDETPAPTISATAPVMPSVSPTVAPSPELSMTTSPREAASANSGSNNQSWTATGNGGTSSAGGTSSGSSSSSSTGKTSTGTSSSSGSGSTSSTGGSSSGSGSASGGTSSGSTGSSSATVSNSGTSSNKISSQLATGGEVIYNTGTGRYLMTFVVGNTRYYANVSAGSTTEQVHNKPYTVTADPTSETYNGNTVYEITTLTKYEGDYLLPNSGTKLLTDSDIKGMSKYDLALARNEIFSSSASFSILANRFTNLSEAFVSEISGVSFR